MPWYDLNSADEEDDSPDYRSARKRRKPMGAGFPHIPNSSERRELVRLMQASGMSEDEVRADKSNRQKLAKAAKEPQVGNMARRFLILRKRFLRNQAARMGLLATDPRVIATLKDKTESMSFRHHGMSNESCLWQRVRGY